MKQLILLFAVFIFNISFAQKCTPLPDSSWRINKSSLKLGDTLKFTVRNTYTDTLYFCDRSDCPLIVRSTMNNYSYEILAGSIGASCPVLTKKLSPGDSITFTYAPAQTGNYSFYFGASKIPEVPDSKHLAKKWVCTDVEFKVY